mmetsp:Transcript_27242/g.38013  ORF Transcript_27242/g.38013 Transcript_27242/m.38013 type:complete len:115 (+) Transcript_27242:101-445(+)
MRRHTRLNKKQLQSEMIHGQLKTKSKLYIESWKRPHYRETKKRVEVEKLQVEVQREKEACKDIAKLKEKIRGELAVLKKDRDWYKREVYAQAKKAEQLKSRLDNLKAANAHLHY